MSNFITYFARNLSKGIKDVFRERGYEVEVTLTPRGFDIETTGEVSGSILQEVVDEASRRIGAERDSS